MLRAKQLILLALLAFSSLVFAQERIALVIGIADYETAPLTNTLNDAVDIASALKELGFDVTLGIDVEHAEMEELIIEFGSKLNSQTTGLFYYAGHAVQSGETNYLIPKGAISKVNSSPNLLKYKTVASNWVLDEMNSSGSQPNFVFLDACRDNPFKSWTRGIQQGLLRMDSVTGNLISYSTGPGDVALDGKGRNSPYASRFLRELQTPNQLVGRMMEKIAAGVNKDTNQNQTPWMESSLIGDFCFNVKNDGCGKEPNITLDTSSVNSENPVIEAVDSPTNNDAETMVQLGYSLLGKDDTKALEWFEKAGHTEGATAAQINLAFILAETDERGAFAWYLKAAEGGHVAAQYTVAQVYDAGMLVNEDEQKAFQWYLRASEGGHIEAQYNLAYKYDVGKGIAENNSEAVKWYIAAADNGHVTAQANLAQMYDLGEGVVEDDEKALKFYLKAANQGHAIAQLNLAIKYDNGDGVYEDNQEAIHWYQKAADQGFAVAQANLGVMYAMGEGVEQDYAKAMSLYLQAAEQKYAPAYYSIALAYSDGEGVAIDHQKAFNYFLMAGKRGHADAQYSVALMLERGIGIQENDKQAFEWHKKAAASGNALAQFAIAQKYDMGEYVLEDNEQAFQWYQQAAQSGHTIAQYMIAEKYRTGDGVNQDLKQAFSWYQLAATEGHAGAQFHTGFALEAGNGTSADPSKAAQWYKRAADQGHAGAQFNLAMMYNENRGVSWDGQAAISLLTMAADQNYSPAQKNLARAYLEGGDVQKDVSKAIKLYTAAANQGDVDAEYALALLYDHGKVVEQNFEVAANWYYRASRRGYAPSQVRLAEMYEVGSGVEKNNEKAYEWYSRAAEGGLESAIKAIQRWGNNETESQINKQEESESDNSNANQAQQQETNSEESNGSEVDMGSLKSSYIDTIIRHVRKEWRYMGGDDGWGCDVYIIQNEDGYVKEVNVQDCTNVDIDQEVSLKSSIERAVQRASPLPLASYQGVFEAEIMFYFVTPPPERGNNMFSVPHLPHLDKPVDDHLNSRYEDESNVDSETTPFVIFFAKGDVWLAEDSKQVVINHANFMIKNPELVLRLEGHADYGASREINLALGEERGLSIKKLLITHGVGERVTVVSFGKEQPLSFDHDKSKINRRVEFVYNEEAATQFDDGAYEGEAIFSETL